MKTFGKIIICIIVVIAAIGVAYLIFNNGEKDTSTNVSNTVQNNTDEQSKNNNVNEIDKENKDYIGEEENKEEPEETNEPETTEPEQNVGEKEEQKEPELTGKDKAVDIVKKQYATDGQTVRFDHMEGNNYVIKLNDGTAVTWYLVNGTTWEAEEY